MNEIDVYSQYFRGACLYHDIPRRAALVSLTCATGGGQIQYTVRVTFFPFRDETDFAITYDACAQAVIYEQKGRRSKKREAKMMDSFRTQADELAQQLGGCIHWDCPLRDARWG